jgi:salicylate hydroxylase
LALMGDAAHAMLPYLTQGAVQSIEDAAVLAKCLERADVSDVGAALWPYKEIRKPRASRCQAGSRSNGVMYHLADGEEQRRRDSNLGAAATAPWPQSSSLYGHDV